MKILPVIAIAVMATLFTTAYAYETENEQTEATKKELSREVNKAVNRVTETVCMDSDAECLKQKVVNRAVEAKDAVKDKASEIKNKVDE